MMPSQDTEDGPSKFCVSIGLQRLQTSDDCLTLVYPELGYTGAWHYEPIPGQHLIFTEPFLGIVI